LVMSNLKAKEVIAELPSPKGLGRSPITIMGNQSKPMN